MTRKKNDTATEGAVTVLPPHEMRQLAEQSLRLNDAMQLAQRLGYRLPDEIGDHYLDADQVQRDIAANMRRSVEACLEVGRGLCVLKAMCEHGQFARRLDTLGMDKHVATRFMQAATRFSAKLPTSATLKAIGSQSKLFEMLVLDDEQLDELLLTGQTGELALDDVATMSVKELRAAVREAREEHKALEEVSKKKSEQIDKLQVKLKRVQAAPPDEAMVELKREAAAFAADAQGVILGGLREAVRVIREHAAQQGEDGQHDVFLAGLIGQVQAALVQVRDGFLLPDVSKASLHAEFLAYLQSEEAEAAAQATAASARRAPKLAD